MRGWPSVGGSRRLLAAFIAVALTSVGVGVLGAQIVRSPAQVAADQKAPARTDLTVKVTEGNLVSSVNFVGTVSAGKTLTLAPADSEGKIVTGAAPRKGSTVRAGSVVVELNDRPVILLTSKYPLYRDLSFGMVGDDVSRLQDALRNANYAVYDAQGRFGASTASAIQRLYANTGYAAPLEPKIDAREESDEPDSASKSSKNPRRFAQIKQSEILMVPALPAELSISTFKSGVAVSKGELTFALSAPIITASLNPVDAEELSKGQEVTYTSSEDDVFHGVGTISSIDEPKASGDEGFVSQVKIRPRVTLASGNESKSLVITATNTEAQTGLLVPLSAIYTSTSGANSVQVVSAKRKLKIPVDVVGQADGMVRIVSKRLAVGDRVVVGVS